MPAGIPKICLAESANGKSNNYKEKELKFSRMMAIYFLRPKEREREPERERVEYGGIYTILYICNNI